MSALWLWRVWLFVLNLAQWALQPYPGLPTRSHLQTHKSLLCATLTMYPLKERLKKQDWVLCHEHVCFKNNVAIHLRLSTVCVRLHLQMFGLNRHVWRVLCGRSNEIIVSDWLQIRLRPLYTHQPLYYDSLSPSLSLSLPVYLLLRNPLPFKKCLTCCDLNFTWLKMFAI